VSCLRHERRQAQQAPGRGGIPGWCFRCTCWVSFPPIPQMVGVVGVVGVASLSLSLSQALALSASQPSG